MISEKAKIKIKNKRGIDMKTKAIKVLAMALLLIVTMSVVSACSGGVPNGRYEPVDSNAAASVQAIIIDGNNFTSVVPVLGGMTVKYTYNKKTGAITLTDGTDGYTAYEYKDGSIWLVTGFGDVEFKKTK